MRFGHFLPLLLLTTPLLLADTAPDAMFDKRFGSFTAAGYDPLTAPPEWYAPTETVKGGDAPWLPVASEGERRVSGAALKAAAAFAEAQNSSALIVVQGGRVQFERYWRDDGPDSIFNPQSMSKTVVALMVGAAIADGKIGSIADTVDRYVPEWRGQPRGGITIENLLNMASGLEQIEGKFGYTVSAQNPGARQSFGSDFYGPILKMQPVEAPGKRFDYNNNDANLLGIIVQRATGRRYADYLSEKLWKPLGLHEARLYLDREGGNPVVACCILSQPRDWAKIGQLLLQKGKWNGRQVADPAWLAAMAMPSKPYRGYGYQLWVGDQTISPTRAANADRNAEWQSEPFAAPDLVTLRGYGFQRVWVVPSLDLVIVRAGKSWPTAFDEAVIPNTIIRGMKSMDKR